uniref:Uncharacterized protein n=1 Tax=Rhizophora mucronata TaxID=61149 RepID=A0A2P2JMN3_RHIMU
MFRESRSS